MSVSSLQFLIAFFLISTLFFYLPGLQWRKGLVAASNSAFIYLLVPNLASWITLGFFLLSGYAVARLLSKWPSRFLLSTYLVVLIVCFLVIKKYEIVTAHLPESIAAHLIVIVGLSYMLFRQIHFLVDSSQGQIENTSLWKYLNYQLSLFTILAGPIQRYQDFCCQWEQLSPVLEDRHAIQLAHFRLLIGIVKISVFATIFLYLYQSSADVFTQVGLGQSGLGPRQAIGYFLGVLYFYPIYLYLNFSGYCDIVIAAALFMGMKLPENFDHPYLARNVLDYWTRWHRTLGFWIRDYLFLPLYKGVAERWPGRADSLSFLCYFVAFFAAGIWHGPTPNFMIYGLFQAVGASAAKLWEREVLKRRGRSGLKQYLESSRVRAMAIVATLHYQCVSLLFFPVDIQTTVQMFRTVIEVVR